MFDKVLDLVKNKDITIPKLLFFNYKKLGLDEKELVILVFLLNQTDTLYNPKNISDNLNVELVDVLTLISGLTEKGIISILMDTKGNRKAEIIDLNPLYEKLTFIVVNKEKENDTTIYSIIENEFARALSPLEYELVNTWVDNGYTEEIIKEALKEAIYNDVTNLKYIDKILEEWHKKGIKTKEDVLANKKKYKERKKVQKEEFYWDWLNEEE